MSDNYGVLGADTTVVAVGTNTIYTVPAGKSARVKIFFRLVAGNASTYGITINGVNIFTTTALTTNNIHYSTASQAFNGASSATQPGGSSPATTVQPFSVEYALSAGDLVQDVIGAQALVSKNVQVIGAEIDIG